MSERQPTFDDQILTFIRYHSAALNGLTLTLEGDEFHSLELGLRQIKRHFIACLDLSDQLSQPRQRGNLESLEWERLVAPKIVRDMFRPVTPGLSLLPNLWLNYFTAFAAASMGGLLTEDSAEVSLSSRGLFVEFGEAVRTNSIDLTLIISASAAASLILIVGTFCLQMIREGTLRSEITHRITATLIEHLHAEMTLSEQKRVIDGLLTVLESVKERKRLLGIKFHAPGAKLSVSLEGAGEARKYQP